MAARGSGPGGLAARYATALFELADDKHQLDEVATDLTALKAMIADSDDLRRLLLKCRRDIAPQEPLRRWLARVPAPRSVRVQVDVDPYSFL